MSHKLPLIIEMPQKRSKKPRFSVKRLDIQGRFGFTLSFLTKEVFLGIVISPVQIEEVVRRKMVKVPKGKVKVYNFD